MRKPQNTLASITVRTALLLIPLIFIVIVLIFSVTGRYFKWPSTDDQRTTAIYIAVAFSLLPIMAYLLNLFAQNQASIGVKVFGTDITFDFSKNMTTVRQLEVPDNIFSLGPGATIASSGSEEIVRAIANATSSPVATLDIRDGRTWWLSRLLALSAGAVRFGLPDAIVFVGRKENVDRTFLGWAEPRPMFEAITRDYPEYESLYMKARAIFNQLSLFSGPDIASTVTDNSGKQTTYILLPPQVQEYSYTYSIGKEHSFLQILLDQLHKVVEPPNQEPVWITIGLLSALFGHCWYTKAVELNDPSQAQIKQVLDMETNSIPFVRQGQFVGMMKSHQALKIIVQQVISG